MRKLIPFIFLSALLVALSFRYGVGPCGRSNEKDATKIVARTAEQTARVGFDLVERAY